jgi:hypothetical protein
MWLRMAAAPLSARGSFENPRFKALQLKRKAWGGREEDGNLTNLLTEAIKATNNES